MAGGTLTPPAGTEVRAPATPAERRAALRERIEAAGLDALVVLDLADIRYLSGFTGSAGLLVLLADGADAFSPTSGTRRRWPLNWTRRST